MKTTPFTETHIALGAKMHEFAGYNMPIEYSGIIDEHMTVCNGVGVFDVSHMGEFWVKGPNALEFLQQVTSNAFGPFTQNSPMCDTSNTPTPLQTVMCSSIMPEYSIGML